MFLLLNLTLVPARAINIGICDKIVCQEDRCGPRFLTHNLMNDFLPAWPPYRGTYMKDDEGSNLVRLTDKKIRTGPPAWSPDGKKIAFVVDINGNHEICVMNADGNNFVRLTNNEAYDWDPTWSPDGTKIAFESDRNGEWEIFVINANGRDIVKLTQGDCPDWSPDGTKIAFNSNRDGNDEIYVMNADGSNLVKLTNNEAHDWVPDWSPDGKKMVFTSDRDGNFEIYVMNADGNNPVRLTYNMANDYAPVWSPDGTEIAFDSVRDGNDEIYVMNADGNNPVRLTNNAAIDCCPDWSPDGTRIAFFSCRDGAEGILILLLKYEESKAKANLLFQGAIQLLSEDEYDKAIERFSEAEEIYRLLFMTSEVSRCKEYQKRSEAESNLEDGAEDSISRALSFFQQLRDSDGAMRCKKALANIYYSQGKNLFEKKQYQEAKAKLEKSLELYDETNDSNGSNLCSSTIEEINEILQNQKEAETSFVMAQEYIEKGDPKNAITHAQNARTLYQGLGDEEKLLECDQLISNAQREINRKNLIMTIEALCAILISGIGILKYKMRKRKSRDLHELEQTDKDLDGMLKRDLITEKEYRIAKREIQEQLK